MGSSRAADGSAAIVERGGTDQDTDALFGAEFSDFMMSTMEIVNDNRLLAELIEFGHYANHELRQSAISGQYGCTSSLDRGWQRYKDANGITAAQNFFGRLLDWAGNVGRQAQD